MSWSLSVGQVSKADFDAAVDAATASPPAPGDGSDFDAKYGNAVAEAKAALKSLAASVVTDDYLTGSAAGHVPDGNQGDWPFNSVNVSVNGVTPPPAEAETPAEVAEAAEEPAAVEPAPAEAAPVEPAPVEAEVPAEVPAEPAPVAEPALV